MAHLEHAKSTFEPLSMPGIEPKRLRCSSPAQPGTMAHLEHAKSTFEPLSMPDVEPMKLEPMELLGACGAPWQRQLTASTACPSEGDFGPAGFDGLTSCETGCEREGPGALDEGVPMQRGAQAWTEEDAADRHAFRLRREDHVDYWLGLFRDADDSVLEAALKGGPGGEGADPQLWAAVDPGLALAWQGDAEDGPGRSREAEDGDRHAFRIASSPVLFTKFATAVVPSLALA